MANLLGVKLTYNKDLDISKIGKHVADGLPNLRREMLADVCEELITRTPVKTGRAAMGWSAGLTAAGRGIPTLNSPYLDDSNMELGKSESEVLERPRSIIIVNRVPYIGELEFGSSSQAPSGFIRAGIKAGMEKAMRRVPEFLDDGFKASKWRKR